MPVTVYPAPASNTDNDPVPQPRSTTSEGGAGSTERNNARHASRTAGSRSPWSASSSNDDASASQKPAVSSIAQMLPVPRPRRTRPGYGDRMSEERYVKPGWFTQHVFNPTVQGLTKLGISVWGSRELRVRGRTSGEWRTNPVNLLTIDDTQYLVAPRGITQWVKNLRVAREGELRVGKKIEQFRANELADDEKPPILRAYLKRWKAEVGVFFDGVGPDASDDELRAIGPKHPVFKIETSGV